MSDVVKIATVNTVLGADRLALRSVSGQEQLGRPFMYELELYGDDNIALSDVLGTDMTLTLMLQDDATRYLHGIVTSFAQTGSDEHEQGRALYHAVLRPALWLLTQSADCRIFQRATIPDVVKEVLQDFGVRSVEDALAGSYRRWEYLVQYRETAFNFISRLLEQEGIYYYFKHTDGQHTLVLADSGSAHAPAPGYEQVMFLPGGQLDPHAPEHLSAWQVVQRIQSGAYILNDYDYLRPAANLEAQLAAPKNHEHAKLEIYDYPGEYSETGDGEHYARVRLQELHAQFELARARGSVRGLGAGALFSLVQHPRRDQNREYLLLSLSFELDAGGFASGDSAGNDVFQCEITALDSRVPFRAARTTPKPLASGPQTAVVVGGPQDEIAADELGRVRVKFPWDRKGKAPDTTCWIRVAQVWAGSGWGSMHIPRVGQEVIVEFIEGDPDRPIITGRVYNGTHEPPYALPEHLTQSGIKSRSTKHAGPDNFNEIRFEDKKGDEQLYVQAERNMDTLVKRDQTHAVGGNRTRSVAKDESIGVDGNRSKTVGKSETVSVGDDQSVSVGKNLTLDVGENATLSITKALSVSVDKNETHSVGEGRVLQVQKDDQVDVGGSRKQSIAKDELLDVGKTLTISAGDQIVLKAGSATITLKKDGKIVIDGKDITLNGSGKINVKASSDVAIKGSKVKAN